MEEMIAKQEALFPQELQPQSEFCATVSTSAAITESAAVSATIDAIIGEVPPEMRSHYGMWLEVRDETDRGAAILAAAYLDDRLNDAISATFYRSGRTAQRLLAPNGALGQYAAKCQVAYCLGLYGKTILKALMAIGDIRNKFAHSKHPLSFTDPVIVESCNQIKGSGDPYFDINPDRPYRSKYLNAAQCIGLILAGEMNRDDQPERRPPRFAG